MGVCMIRTPSIAEEIARADLQRDFENAGYSAGDAARLTSAIMAGRLLPGLARHPRRAERTAIAGSVAAGHTVEASR